METFTFETLPAQVAEMSQKLDILISQQPNRLEEPDKLLTIQELQDYLKEKPARQTVYGWVSNRKVPYEKHGRTLYFRRSSIEKWLNNGRHV